MNEIAVVDKGADWRRIKSLVLDSISSPITKRVYNLGLDEFFAWYGQEPRPGFTKATVAAWRVALEARGLGAVSINVRITAVRKLAVEAADNGLLAPELANGITRVKGVASKGIRLGNWLSAKQAQALLNAPDASTIKGTRDRAILAVLLGCGLRRSEVAALTFKHIQQRDGRWCIVDLVGKHGRVRTVPMPTWVKVAVDAWVGASGISDGAVFRSVNRGGKVRETALSEKVVWQLIQPYAEAAGVAGIAPHDCRRYAESRTMPNRHQYSSSGAQRMAVRLMLITGRMRLSPFAPRSCNPNLQVGGEFKGSVHICVSDDAQTTGSWPLAKLSDGLLRQARAPSPNPAIIDCEE